MIVLSKQQCRVRITRTKIPSPFNDMCALRGVRLRSTQVTLYKYNTLPLEPEWPLNANEYSCKRCSYNKILILVVPLQTLTTS